MKIYHHTSRLSWKAYRIISWRSILPSLPMWLQRKHVSFQTIFKISSLYHYHCHFSWNVWKLYLLDLWWTIALRKTLQMWFHHHWKSASQKSHSINPQRSDLPMWRMQLNNNRNRLPQKPHEINTQQRPISMLQMWLQSNPSRYSKDTQKVKTSG